VTGSTKQTTAFYAGLFLMTAATLMLQVIQTRILSVVAWYHLAFFVIGIAMFGLTAGAVWVYLKGERFSEATLSYDLAFYSAAFAVANALALVLQLSLSPVIAQSLTAAISWLIVAVCISVPFFFSGVVVSLSLTRSPFPIGRVYGVDMAGAALGCFGVLGLLNLTDAPSAILWVSVIGLLASLSFARSAVGGTPAELPFMAEALRPRSGKRLLVIFAVFAALNGLYDRGLHPISVKGKIEIATSYPVFQEWNSFSRIAVFDEGEKPPDMLGPSPHFDGEAWVLNERLVNIDGDAATVAYEVRGDLDKAGFLRFDVTNIAYYMPRRASAAIVGVGGGRDILAAKVLGVDEVVGVEINPILVRLMTREHPYAESVGLDRLDNVTIEVDEARSWFARSGRAFDVIQMSLTDTWAATGAGAFTLSENGLYTVEAWKIFLQRLTREGVFTVSRWYAPGMLNEAGRLVSLAASTLLELGAVEPRRHLFLVVSGRIATLVVSRSPFSAEATEALESASERLGFTVVVSPRAAAASEVLRHMLGAPDRAALEAYTRGLALDLSPATDERPFFFNLLPLHDPAGMVSTLASGDFPKVTTAYFLLIGVGFMAAEIGLMQRLSVFLGHPIYSLSVVLFSMILTTGIGSLISDRLPLDRSVKLAAWALVVGVYLTTLPLWLGQATLAFDGEGLLVRGMVSILVIAPAGVLMGWGFPTGIRLVSALDRRPTPWFWGINGAAGVLASALAVAISIAFGISVTLILAGVCYWLVVPAALVIGLARPYARASPSPL
jgi:hypothetical protein